MFVLQPFEFVYTNSKLYLFLYLAEAGGFEPPVQLPVRQFSKLVVSATHPHFLGDFVNKSTAKVQKCFHLVKQKHCFYSKFIYICVAVTLIDVYL